MDYIFYYSNYCKFSKEVIQFLTKNGLMEKMNCICIDKRYKDPKTGTTNILMENGKTVVLPIHITNVPSLLQIKNNFTVIVGEVNTQTEIATGYQNEPSNYSFNDTHSVVSEKYTYYNMTSDELSAKGKGKNRQMHNYLDANHNPSFINAPPETYKKEKMSEQITIDFLQKKRDEDYSQSPENTQSFMYGR